MDKFLVLVKTHQCKVKGGKCLPVETGRNRQRRRRTVPNIGENKNSRKLLYLNDWSDPEQRTYFFRENTKK